MDSLCDSAIPVKTTNNFSIRVGPDEVKTVNGIARKTGEINAAVTEHINKSLSGDLTMCPRAVSFKLPVMFECQLEFVICLFMLYKYLPDLYYVH